MTTAQEKKAVISDVLAEFRRAIQRVHDVDAKAEARHT